MSLEGHAPKFFRKCTKNGVPIYCFGLTMVFTLLSLLQINAGTGTVITWYVRFRLLPPFSQMPPPNVSANTPVT